VHTIRIFTFTFCTIFALLLANGRRPAKITVAGRNKLVVLWQFDRLALWSDRGRLAARIRRPARSGASESVNWKGKKGHKDAQLDTRRAKRVRQRRIVTRRSASASGGCDVGTPSNVTTQTAELGRQQHSHKPFGGMAIAMGIGALGHGLMRRGIVKQPQRFRRIVSRRVATRRTSPGFHPWAARPSRAVAARFPSFVDSGMTELPQRRRPLASWIAVR
jgi:hypothetical protein